MSDTLSVDDDTSLETRLALTYALVNCDEVLQEMVSRPADGEVVDRWRQLLGDVQHGLEVISQVVRGMRSLRPSAPLAMGAVPLAAVVRRSAAMAALDRGAGPLTLDLDETAIVVGNADRLGQLVRNLVVNAIDGRAESARIEVTPRATATSRWWSPRPVAASRPRRWRTSSTRSSPPRRSIGGWTSASRSSSASSRMEGGAPRPEPPHRPGPPLPGRARRPQAGLALGDPPQGAAAAGVGAPAAAGARRRDPADRREQVRRG